ncbi:MAG: hypothetical protein R3F34_12710 [Planctomycetota bacterium]
MWPRPLDAGRAAEVRRVVTDWVKRQDALDRKRNHFIKAFRGEHGSDRNAWSADVLAAYDAGIEDVNGENRARLEEAARALADVRS